ncbi:AAA family ATPase [Nannocystis sp.]|uniref:AAA family ATPase n=1 Tax=Nannocystis sp. TaxID=1962667 RepID=UPI0025D11516|nr:AAA family ATPase [Nannocystis sp.]MBK7828982.1 AAA family ATPase [Nannocystis sp.]
MVDSNRKLRELSLFGYKSIRELRSLRLDLGLNVLIGANGSGKTNFIRFFELLKHVADPGKDLQNYVNIHGRADAFLFGGMKVTRELRGELKYGVGTSRFHAPGGDDRSLFLADLQG